MMKRTSAFCMGVLALLLMAPLHGADEGYGRFSRQKELMREGEQLENLGRYKRAAKAYKRSRLYAVDNRTRAALLVREADCYLEAGKPYDAFTAYETLLQTYPLYVPYEEVLDNLRILAGQFERGKGSMFGWGNRSKAIEVYELILQETPVGKGIMRDSIALGSLLAEADRDLEAIEVYRDALRRFPESPLAPDVQLALGRLLVDESRRGDGGGLIARRAERHLRAFLDARPDDPRREDAEFLLELLDERRADHLYDLGQFYLQPAHKRIPAARRYLNDVVREYPDTTAAPRAETLLASVPEQPEAPPPAGAAVEEGEPGAAPAPEAAPAEVPAPAKPERRVLQGVLPDGTPEEGEPRAYRSLKERENVQKWLRPLDNLEDIKKGDAENE